MSYSLNTKCNQCKKEKNCLDPVALSGARDMIHEIGYSRGHLGSGAINLECQNFVQKEEKVE